MAYLGEGSQAYPNGGEKGQISPPTEIFYAPLGEVCRLRKRAPYLFEQKFPEVRYFLIPSSPLWYRETPKIGQNSGEM